MFLCCASVTKALFVSSMDKINIFFFTFAYWLLLWPPFSFVLDFNFSVHSSVNAHIKFSKRERVIWLKKNSTIQFNYTRQLITVQRSEKWKASEQERWTMYACNDMWWLFLFSSVCVKIHTLIFIDEPIPAFLLAFSTKIKYEFLFGFFSFHFYSLISFQYYIIIK